MTPEKEYTIKKGDYDFFKRLSKELDLPENLVVCGLKVLQDRNFYFKIIPPEEGVDLTIDD